MSTAQRTWRMFPARQLTGRPYVYHGYIGRERPETACGHDHRTRDVAERCAIRKAQSLNDIEAMGGPWRDPWESYGLPGRGYVKQLRESRQHLTQLSNTLAHHGAGALQEKVAAVRDEVAALLTRVEAEAQEIRSDWEGGG